MAVHQLFLSLGGNLGNKREIFADAVEMVGKKIGNPVKVSSLYESPPWGFRSKNLFWNQVLLVETVLSPLEVLGKIRIIENSFGRKRIPGRYLSRKMDIDILLYDDLILRTDDLTIPHYHLANRKFILLPLSEIAPDVVHPQSGEKISQLCLQCADQTKMMKVKEFQP
jgi:2-amino-4-hydroxy-6-hydroxymethyldihydropteridine diphosphokinase